MFVVSKTVQAEQDLDEIWLYIALDNPTAADAMLDAIDRRCRMLAREALIGRARPELAAGLRSFAVARYMIFYAPSDDGILLVRVLHGARDLPTLADQEGFDS